jgi:hypothetical protein
MGQSLEARQAHTASVLEKIVASLSLSASGGASAEKRYGPAATVYATGSYGRCEASLHSDLDLFIVSGESPAPDDGSRGGTRRSLKHRTLSKLEEICLKAQLIELSKSLGLPDFSGDGHYLKCYTGSQLANAIGSEDDDYLNTFTARLLLLLESRPLLGNSVYHEAVDTVIEAYFRDYADHLKDFEPTFLLNDILRLWRTFCVNYENRTSHTDVVAKAKRKLKHYKLSHSRLLTCFSGVVTLLEFYRLNGTVSPDDIRALVAKTPTARICDVGKTNPSAKDTVAKVLDSYERFLERTDVDETALRQQFLDKIYARARMAEARQFAVLIHNLVSAIDAGRLSRAIVV